MNTHLQEAVSSKTIRFELHMASIHCRVAISRPLIATYNALSDECGVASMKIGSKKKIENAIWSDE